MISPSVCVCVSDGSGIFRGGRTRLVMHDLGIFYSLHSACVWSQSHANGEQQLKLAEAIMEQQLRQMQSAAETDATREHLGLAIELTIACKIRSEMLMHKAAGTWEQGATLDTHRCSEGDKTWSTHMSAVKIEKIEKCRHTVLMRTEMRAQWTSTLQESCRLRAHIGEWGGSGWNKWS